MVKFQNTWLKIANKMKEPIKLHFLAAGCPEMVPECYRCTRGCCHSSLGSLERGGSLHYSWPRSHTPLEQIRNYFNISFVLCAQCKKNAINLGCNEKCRFRPFPSVINENRRGEWGFHWRNWGLISIIVAALCTAHKPSVTTPPMCPLNSSLFLLLCLHWCNSRITAVILWINHPATASI